MVSVTPVEAPVSSDRKAISPPRQYRWAIIAIASIVPVLVLSRLLIQFEPIAWFSNGIFLCCHLTTLLIYVLALRGTRTAAYREKLTHEDMADRRDFNGRRIRYSVAGSLIGTLASFFLLSIRISNHTDLAALATAVSLVGVIVEYQFCWTFWRKERRFDRLMKSGGIDASHEILRPSLRIKKTPHSGLKAAGKAALHLQTVPETSVRSKYAVSDRSLDVSRVLKAAGMSYRLRQFDAGYSLLEEAVKKEPHNIKFRVTQCLFLLAMNRHVEAHHYWKELKESQGSALRTLFDIRDWRKKILQIQNGLGDTDEL